MLTVQCPDCDYQDQGHDTDLIMTAYRRHEIECTGQRAGIFMQQNLGGQGETSDVQGA